MINKGKHGSLSFFLENKLIASVPIDKDHPYEYWERVGNDIILDGMRDSKMKLQGSRGIKTAFWKCLHKMKQYDNKLSQRDNIFVAQAFMALIKLKQIDPDGDQEGLLLMPSKRPVVRR